MNSVKENETEFVVSPSKNSLKRKSIIESSDYPETISKKSLFEDLTNKENVSNNIEPSRTEIPILNSSPAPKTTHSNISPQCSPSNINAELTKLEQESKKDNLKADKNKIKKRRSSFGKFLSKPPCPDFSPAKNEVVARSSEEGACGGSATSGLSVIEDVCEVKSDQPPPEVTKYIQKDLVLVQEPNVVKENSEDISLPPKVKAFQEKCRKLEEEYRIWKRLVKSRKHELRQAEREFRESKKGETVIEEDDIWPHLNNEQKTILLSRPNYNQYMQEVKQVKEQVVLTKLEGEKATRMYEALVSVSKYASQACYSKIEEKTLGDLLKKDPRDLLQAMMT